MADDSKEPPKKKKGRFRRILPNRPRIRRGELKATEEFTKLREGMTQTRHLCPHDATAMELISVYPTDASGEIPEDADQIRALVCPQCQFTVPAEELAELMKRDAAPLKQTERQFTLLGFGLLILFVLIFVLNHNVLTLVGALLFSLTLFLKALFYRYRYWQAINGRMFLDKAPVKEWLREEWASK